MSLGVMGVIVYDWVQQAGPFLFARINSICGVNGYAELGLDGTLPVIVVSVLCESD